MKKMRTMVLAAMPVALAVAISGCAGTGGDAPMPGMNHGEGSSSTEQSEEFNQADVIFAAMMIPHHQQAIEMSDLILEKALVDERVVSLAQQIKDAQAPEIELMQSWLEEWAMPMPDDMSGMEHGDGMMSADDMEALESADGPTASRLFLEQMIEHHEGAIDMAESELDDGVNAAATELAQQIIDSQTTEIAVMLELLDDI